MRRLLLATVAGVLAAAPAAHAGSLPSFETGPRPGPPLLYSAPPARPAARERRALSRTAAAGLRHRRLPARRVPLPGLPVRRPRRRDRRRDVAAGHGRLLAGERRPGLPRRRALRQQRRRHRRAAHPADARRDRLPRHPRRGARRRRDRRRHRRRHRPPRRQGGLAPRRRAELARPRPLHHRLGHRRRGDQTARREAGATARRRRADRQADEPDDDPRAAPADGSGPRHLAVRCGRRALVGQRLPAPGPGDPGRLQPRLPLRRAPAARQRLLVRGGPGRRARGRRHRAASTPTSASRAWPRAAAVSSTRPGARKRASTRRA